MNYNELPTTFIYWFDKPENRKILEGFKARKDKSCEEFVRYYLYIINTLKGTPCWGKPGVNKMLNKLTAAVSATLKKEKAGKSSAFAQAYKLLDTVDYHRNKKAVPHPAACTLKPLLTEAELQQLLALN